MGKPSPLKIDDMTVDLVFEWCKKKWGPSKFHDDYPQLFSYSCKNRDGLYGFYDEKSNELHIHLCYHKSVINLIRTVIHEYTHYTQNVALNYDRYAARAKKYYDNPYERAAENRANKYDSICKKELTKLLS